MGARGHPTVRSALKKPTLQLHAGHEGFDIHLSGSRATATLNRKRQASLTYSYIYICIPLNKGYTSRCIYIYILHGVDKSRSTFNRNMTQFAKVGFDEMLDLTAEFLEFFFTIFIFGS